MFALDHSVSPLNIGLYGKWGVGKSSILKLLEGRLEQDKFATKFRYVYIDAWKLAPSALKQELLIELNDKVGRVISRDEILDMLYNVRQVDIGETRKQKALRYLRFSVLAAIVVASVIAPLWISYQADPENQRGQLTLGATLAILLPSMSILFEKLYSLYKSVERNAKKIIPKVESSQQFQALFDQIVAKATDRSDKDNENKSEKNLVIAIDNLDRCDDRSVVEILGYVKTFMDKEGCIFLIACDDEAIINYLRNVKGEAMQERNAVEFLTKFFQITIKIPPIIEGDLDSYAENLVASMPMIVSKEVPSILIAGALKSPRKIVQFVNNLVILLTLAQMKEDKGILQKGVITNNTAFLAKMLVLREEFPAFYRKLEQNEYMLEFAERLITGDKSEDIRASEIEAAFEKEKGLEFFLKATRPTTATDIRPFLRLNQESYEGSITELDLFVERVRNNDVKFMREILSEATEEEREYYVQEAIQLIDLNMSRERFNWAANSMNVLLNVFDLIPKDKHDEVIDRLGSFIQDKSLDNYLKAIDVGLLFSILHLMKPHLKKRLIEIYTSKLILGTTYLDRPLLDEFIKHNSLLTEQQRADIDEKLSIIISANDADGVYIIERLIEMGNPNGIAFLGEKVIHRFIEKINNTVPQQEYVKRLELYTKIESFASVENKKRYVEQLIKNIPQNAKNTKDFYLRSYLEQIRKLDDNDLTPAAAEILFSSLKPTRDSVDNDQDKARVVESMLVPFNKLPDMLKRAAVDNYFAPSITSYDQGRLIDFVRAAADRDSQILQFGSILDNLLNRINSEPGIIDQRVVDFILKATPKDAREKVAKFIINHLQNKGGTASNFLPALKANLSSFTTEQLEKIALAAIKSARKGSYEESKYLTQIVVLLLDSASNKTKDMLVTFAIDWTTSGDLNQRKHGLRILKESFEKVPESLQKTIKQRLNAIKDDTQNQRLWTEAKTLFGENFV